MTDRDKRLLSFLVGDLEDAHRDLRHALCSDLLSPQERSLLEKSLQAIRVIRDRKKKELNNA